MKILLLLILMPTLFSASIHSQTAPPLETGVSQTLAKWRSRNYSDVRYKLNITLEKGAPLMKGTIEISVKLTDEGAKNDLILDWRTTQFANDKDKPFADVVSVNGTQTTSPAMSAQREQAALYLNVVENKDRFRADTLIAGESPAFQSAEHLIVSKKYLKTGENVLQINFASPIKTSGAAITRYVDKEDGAEYIYSLFVPSDASTAFPVFDQPDLKAHFQLTIISPLAWQVVSNSKRDSVTINDPKKSLTVLKHIFAETKPISTYVFAFAAGEFERFIEGYDRPISVVLTEDEEINKEKYAKDSKRPTAFYTRITDENLSNILVRKSQAEKFKQHAAEVFRLNREGVKFLESYFDYQFPFPKYDLVLIPEFPFGGMEHAGATFLRESSIIFPTEPTKNDLVSRANVIFHEAAHQWFGDTVTMKWFDDLWLKEGFAEFMAYKTMEKVLPEYNAWKIFYERNKQAAYLTDSTKGTTPIYQEIPNLSAAKSAYGNIVYRKAPSFLKQAEFYLGEKEFQTAVRAFLKKHEFANAEWTDLVKEFESEWLKQPLLPIYYPHSNKNELKKDFQEWANSWVKKSGVEVFSIETYSKKERPAWLNKKVIWLERKDTSIDYGRTQEFKVLFGFADGKRQPKDIDYVRFNYSSFAQDISLNWGRENESPTFIFPNYQDYGYGIFLLDEKSRAYVLANIQNEKDDFLRSMMWGALWDSVREGELNPKDYVELVIKNLARPELSQVSIVSPNDSQPKREQDETTLSAILARVSTAMNYYLSDAARAELAPQLEGELLEGMSLSETAGQQIVFFRAFVNTASSESSKLTLKLLLNGTMKIKNINLKTKDKFDILTRLAVLGDSTAPQLLADLQKTETSDEAKRYAYAVGAAFPTKAAKEKYFDDLLNNREISESYIESATLPFNSVSQSQLTLPFLERALAELPNLKKNRKIFFVNGWLNAFIGGQKSAEALAVVNKFLTDNPNLDQDLRLKILENADGLERAVKIRAKFGN